MNEHEADAVGDAIHDALDEMYGGDPEEVRTMFRNAARTTLADVAPPALACAICMYVVEGIAQEAVTVIEGNAVCYDHISTPSAAFPWMKK